MRLTRWLLTVWIGCVLVFLPAKSLAFHRPEHLELSAKAAAVIDVQSGRILYEKNAGKQMRIASLTKIMTAIVAIENGDLKEKVKVKPRAVGVEGSSIYLKPGEEIPLEHLLYGLMLRSGNDAAVAIAEHVGGSMEGFVYKMNEKAEYLGLENTHFRNPHGLDAPEHYSSAEDLARLTAYALKNPVFRKIVSTQVKTVPWPGEQWHRKWYNKNKMLRLYPGGDGVKTGFTKLSRRTFGLLGHKGGKTDCHGDTECAGRLERFHATLGIWVSSLSKSAVSEKRRRILPQPERAGSNGNRGFPFLHLPVD